jgi:hypothetical protein
MDDHPARDVGPAASRTRQTWAGHGRLVRVEKNGVGRFLHDVTRVFADVSVPALPTLLFVGTTSDEGFDLRGGVLFAWLALVVVATLVRGGWVAAPFTPRRGWLALTPLAVGVRVVAFNVALVAAGVAGIAVGRAVGSVAVVALALAVGTGTALVAPALAERAYDAVVRRR